jgi:hypothetical protein
MSKKVSSTAVDLQWLRVCLLGEGWGPDSTVLAFGVEGLLHAGRGK